MTASAVAEDVHLKEIERKAWTRYFDDGILDIFFGLLLMGFAVYPFLEGVGVWDLLGYVVAVVPAYVVFLVGKRYVTAPRIGLVKFGPRRRSRTMKAKLALAGSVLFGLAVMIIAMSGLLPVVGGAAFGAVAFGVNAIIVFGVMAYFLDVPRFSLHGVLFASSIAIVELSRGLVGPTTNVVVGFGVPGLIIVLIGGACLARFLRTYPLPTGE